MSISRKNWSALSSLTRQWTVEDEEEVERERRRKIRTHSAEPGDSPNEDAPPVFASAEDAAEAVDSEAPVDFVEMLRVRDERRRRRHLEVLRRHHEEEEQKGAGSDGKVGGETEGRRSATPSNSDIINAVSPSENNISDPTQRKTAETPTTPSRRFVSSLSISIDKSPSSPTERNRVVSPLSRSNSTGTGRVVSPLHFASPTDRNRAASPPSSFCYTSPGQGVSPQSPRGSFRTLSPEERAMSPAHGTARPVTQNGETRDGQYASSGGRVPGRPLTDDTTFQRNSPRALSLRMARKREEVSMPLQRSASVRISSKAPQISKATSLDEDAPSPFQRNSRQRISSRSIQEKMERLALAAQKSENVKSPLASQMGLYVLPDEVSRKRRLFEQDQASGDCSPTGARQDFPAFPAGISHQINRWVARAQGPGSRFTSSDLRNVDISSKRNIWVSRSEEASSNASAYK
ncbi:hypothetical protein GJAV_G00192890 [Gymnothorax javanicus]|nr:hypothetical protein GJAV_G00192890 [Gymnothorax javanicus]